MTAERSALVSHLNSILSISDIPDDSCNGLQVEGGGEIVTIGLAVDACLAVFEKAVENKCQMLVVHHGLIWRGLTSIRGIVKRQIEFLIRHDLNLYAVHLPLDLHPELGNNIALARSIGLLDIKPFGAYRGRTIGFMGTAAQPMSVEEIGNKVGLVVGGGFSSLPFGKRLNRTVAIISGGGSEALPEAIEKGVDCFITGESDHRNHHLALEGKINVLYCGHYHTETPGVKALGEHLEKKFDVKTIFIDEPTLV